MFQSIDSLSQGLLFSCFNSFLLNSSFFIGKNLWMVEIKCVPIGWWKWSRSTTNRFLSCPVHPAALQAEEIPWASDPSTAARFRSPLCKCNKSKHKTFRQQIPTWHLHISVGSQFPLRNVYSFRVQFTFQWSQNVKTHLNTVKTLAIFPIARILFFMTSFLIWALAGRKKRIL